ncbi:MAG: hypothetical protein HYV09_33025, partial [Deltaproteobacteria bacterium]|nr:hypothetical protein [Deltaproteobacteria bacterium]
MRRIARTLACLASAWLLFACSSEPSAASGQDASVPDDAESDVFVDADVGDTAKAETSPDACEPYCHWDCSGGPPTCFAGQVWRFGRSPRPCCHYADPWPGPGPTCSTDVVGSCASGCAPSPDPRYAVCGAAPAGPWITYCAEGGSKSAGAPCTTDTECRPAADGIAALRCDLAAKECV